MRKQETVKNKALVAFDLCGKSHTIESNEVEAQIIDLKIKKEQSQCVVYAGDKLCYTVTIYNDSCVCLKDLDFRDQLDTDVHYERNSFKVNGRCENPSMSGRSLCYHINDLKPYEEMVITFEVEVE